MANPYILGGGNPIDALLQGMQAGQGLRQNNQALQMQQLQLDEAKRQRELAIKQQQESEALKVSMAADLQALGQNPTLDQQYAFNLKYSPDKVKAAQEYFGQMNEKQRQYEKGFLYQIGAAAGGENPEQVATMLEDRAKLHDQNGDAQKAAEYRHWAGIAQQNPKMIGSIADMMLFSGMNPDEQKQFLEMRKLPSTIAKTEAEAANIPQSTALEAQRVANQTSATQTDAWYKQQQVSIANARLALDKATAEAKAAGSPEEKQLAGIKLQTAQAQLQKLQADQRAVVAEHKKVAENFDSLATLGTKLLADPALPKIVGPVDSITPNILPSSRAAAADLETLKSKIFMAMTPLMTGTQTDKDAEELKRSWAQLERSTGEEAIKASLRTIISQASKYAKTAREQASAIDQTSSAQPATSNNQASRYGY